MTSIEQEGGSILHALQGYDISHLSWLFLKMKL